MIRQLIIKIIKFYQITISPDHGVLAYHYPQGFCRFTPTCSEYACQAVAIYGFRRGSYLALKRLSRCHPFSRAGRDPLPGKEINKVR